MTELVDTIRRKAKGDQALKVVSDEGLQRLEALGGEGGCKDRFLDFVEEVEKQSKAESQKKSSEVC